MSHLGYASWAFAAGALIPLMAILNGGLARAAGHPAVAAATLFAVGFVFCATIAVLSGVRGVGGLLQAPSHLFGGGIIVGFYILSITVLAPRFGVGNAILFVMVAQIFTSAAIDHFGILGTIVRPVSLPRLIGLGLLIVGLIVCQVAPARAAGTPAGS
ncbi:MAG: DMT family transporter [Hyphomonadaceae bacterium]